ncbi:MAG: glycosyltransferase [Cytophagales bacterium]|nr:glycosyltransferase [Cytophagales bacterium]
MIAPYDIVILALNRCDDVLNSSTWQMANSMAHSKRVLYVNHPKTWLDCLKMRKRVHQKITRHTSNLHCLEPAAMLPTNFLPKGKFYDWLQKINHEWLYRSIIKVLGKGKVELFINAFDFYYPYLQRKLANRVNKVAYYSLDPIVKDRSKKHGIANERKLVADADHVFCSAKSLYDQWQKEHHSVHYLPNAVNFNGLQHQVAHPPKTISMLKGVKVGLFGNIDRRVDLDLLNSTLNAGYMSLVLAGPVSQKCEKLMQLPNVFYYGTYQYHNLRSFVESVDVCLIPYRVTPDMEKIYPLKLMEYFAFGKPVVMTPFNTDQVQQLGKMVYLARTANEMQQAILKAYHEDNPYRRHERKAIAAENNWDSRSKTLLDVVYHDQSA